MSECERLLRRQRRALLLLSTLACVCALPPSLSVSHTCRLYRLHLCLSQGNTLSPSPSFSLSPRLTVCTCVLSAPLAPAALPALDAQRRMTTSSSSLATMIPAHDIARLLLLQTMTAAADYGCCCCCVRLTCCKLVFTHSLSLFLSCLFRTRLTLSLSLASGTCPRASSRQFALSLSAVCLSCCLLVTVDDDDNDARQ